MKQNQAPERTTATAVRERLIGWGLTALAVGAVIVFIVLKMKSVVHSDFTDTAYWAQATLDGHRLFNPAFAYAGLLPFGASLWFLPLVKLWGVSMTTQIVGMILFLLAFVAAASFMAHAFGLSPLARGAFVCTLCLGLSQSEKLREIMWGHTIYYSLGLLFWLVGLGLLARLIASPSEHAPRGVWIAWIIIAIGTATNGFYGLAFFAVPLGMALLLERLFDPKTTHFDSATRRTCYLIVSLVVATLIGLALLLWFTRGGVEAPYARAYSTYSAVTSWGENANRIVPSLLSLCQVVPTKGTSLMSLTTITTGIRIATLIVLMVVPFGGLIRWSRRPRAVRIMVLSHVVMVAIVLYTFICGLLSSAPWRLTPLIGSALVTTFVLVHHALATGWSRPRARGAALLAVVLAAFTALGGLSLVSAPANPETLALDQLVKALRARNLTYGYATFWQGPVAELLSDGQVKLRTVAIDTHGVYPRHYQSNERWYERQPGVARYALVMTPSERRDAELTASYQRLQAQAIETFQVGHFIVWVLPDAPFLSAATR